MALIDNTTQTRGYHKSKALKLSKRGRMIQIPNPPAAKLVLMRSTPVPATVIRDGFAFIPRPGFPGVYKRYVLPVLGDEFGQEINQ
jgi:hypothetical protein